MKSHGNVPLMRRQQRIIVFIVMQKRHFMTLSYITAGKKLNAKVLKKFRVKAVTGDKWVL
jgi:hypothetical protein